MKALKAVLGFFSLVSVGLLSGCSSVDVASVPSDPSAGILYQIFTAHLDGSLTAGDPAKSASVFPLLIQTFNLIVMGAALLIFAYVGLMGVLYTAQDGIFLGKKWSKTFIPLRAILGVVLIFPLGATGFGIAQWMIYWMTYVGIGAGTKLWTGVATQTNSNAVGPLIPQAALDNINNGFAEILFNDLVLNLLSTQASTQNPLSVSVTQSQSKITSAAGVITRSAPTVRINLNNVYVNKLWLTQIGSAMAPAYLKDGVGAGGLTNGYLSMVYQDLCNNPGHWNGYPTYTSECEALLYQAQYNLNLGVTNGIDSHAYDQIFPMNLSYTLPGYQNSVGTFSQNVPEYIQSALVLNGSATLTPLASAPTGATDTGLNSAFQDINNATQSLIGALNGNESYTPSTLLSQLNYSTTLSKIITDLDQDFKKTQVPASDFSNSWWNAGNEYLYVDSKFAQQASGIVGLSQNFLTQISADFNPGMTLTPPPSNDPTVHGTTLKLYFDVEAVNNIGTSLANPNGNSNGYQQEVGGITILPPGNLSTNLTQMIKTSTSWSSLEQQAAYDLACRLGVSSACLNVTVCSSDSGSSCYDSVIPAPLDLTSDPYRSISQYVNYYFLARTGGGVGAPTYTGNEIYQLDLALNYVIMMVLGDGSNSQLNVISNPMILVGSGSPVAGVMGFLFSGLLGNSAIGGGNATGSAAVAGLLGQIWCVGDQNFSDCINSVQNNITGYPNASSAAVPTTITNLIANHFSVIQNAQYVGVNLITGTVDAMLAMYNNFSKAVSAIVSQGSGGVSTGTLVGAAMLPVFGSVSTAGVVEQAMQETVQLASLSVELMWLPIIMVVLTALFTTGIMFALFIPLVPFVLFWAGKVAWLFMVIEAIFAVPLMALGMAYPEGHDLWGMGEQGFKISLNLLLFPMLIILGLVAAMSVTYVVMSFSSYGFHVVSITILNLTQSFGTSATTALPNVSSANGVSVDPNVLVVNGIMTTFMILLYATFISMAFNKCFSLIYIIPEKVMSWIGGQGIKFGEKEAEKMEGAATQQANQAAQAGGQSLTQGAQAQKAVGDSQIQQQQQDSQQEVQVSQSAGQAGVQGLQTGISAAGLAKGG